MKKHGKFYADWQDDTKHRRRKSFPTKAGALRHQSKMCTESASIAASTSIENTRACSSRISFQLKVTGDWRIRDARTRLA